MSRQAGRQTDRILVDRLQSELARIAVKQMPEAALRVSHPLTIPHYTTDLNDAWQLVDYFQALGFEFAVMTTASDQAQLGKWTCAATNGTIAVKSAAATAPLAISRAMLGVLRQLERS